MHHIITQLLDAGYRVEFSKGPDGYVAIADDGAAGVHDAVAATPAAALVALAEASLSPEDRAALARPETAAPG